MTWRDGHVGEFLTLAAPRQNRTFANMRERGFRQVVFEEVDW